MKTICYLMLALLLTSAIGCQRMARLRGARCRPGIRLPSFRSQPQPTQPSVAPCNTCPPSQTVYVQPDGVPMDGTAVEEVVVDPSWTGAATSGTEVNRPIITSGAIIQGGASSGTTMIVPGPESGPLPAN